VCGAAGGVPCVAIRDLREVCVRKGRRGVCGRFIRLVGLGCECLDMRMHILVPSSLHPPLPIHKYQLLTSKRLSVHAS
jgi:hypothetical protein